MWSAAGSGAYTSKPRPAVIVQGDAFVERNSITICLLASDLTYYTPGPAPCRSG
ncbi:type II toxin-antitoxin system PemK/MazF family toxin [Synechococcus sp. 1G10]|uniref:type II toxin-antitoxin system PemK/MazF family toxin n=1 Tax=Synechococcus sp. 1G10 TaxID=2025605 RepID=UPI000B99B130|nr:type II toxin-antitoxin system PemK/MazF family toxin [Synechococcus sp. 1G10]